MKKGYTLTELVTVVAIVGILASVSYPALLNYYHHQRLSTAALEIAGTLNKARALSVARTENRNFGVVMAGTEEIQFQIFSFKPDALITPANYKLPDSGAPHESSVTLDSDVEVASYTGILIFRADGIPTADGVNYPMSGNSNLYSLKSKAIDAGITISVGKTSGIPLLK